VGSTGGNENKGSRMLAGASDGKYHQFKWEAEGTHNYESDRGATYRWFEQNSNVEELYPEVRAHLNAFDYWERGHFMGGQQYGKFSDMDDTRQTYTRIYDNILDRSVINEGVEVHRRATPELLFGEGRRSVTEEMLRNAVGNEVISLGNMSTGAAADGLTIGRGASKPIDYTIRIPAGSVGAGMYIGHNSVNPTWGDQQREFMLNRDTAYRIVGYERISQSERQDIEDRTWDTAPEYRVILEYIGRQPHNYD